jgi:hypothetical protein
LQQPRQPTHPAIITRPTWDTAQAAGEQHGTSPDGDTPHPRARRTYLLRGRVRCRPCRRRMHGATRPSTRYYSGGPDVDHVYYLCPHDSHNPRHAAQAPGHPATVSVREDVLLEQVRRFFATRIFGPDRATLLAEQLPAGAAEDAARREKQAARLRKRLKQIDATEDARVREVQALAELDPNAPAVKAMRTRHLKRFGELEAEREDIGRTLAALSKQATQETGGDPGLLDLLPMLGDLLAAASDRIKQQLFDAFDIQARYSKTHHQVTLWATITPSTPAALAAIIADSETPDLTGLLATQDHVSDLASQPGAVVLP